LRINSSFQKNKILIHNKLKAIKRLFSVSEGTKNR
jgi:hypothetical protein